MFKFKKGDFLKKKNFGSSFNDKYLKKYPDSIKIKKFADHDEYVVEYYGLNKSMKVGICRMSIHSYTIENNYEIDLRASRNDKIDKLI